ncbi:phage tail protein [Pseudomonas mucidolens]|uniref:phage tail-collar fiber domain-containing protein n=1 Tax=Pseudomonas mucidolens TaxID=46679 RepID=UPI0030D968A3
MGASITLAGESLIAKKLGSQQRLDVVRFVFANVPGLNPSAPVNRAAAKPPAAQIVHTYTIPPQNIGFVNPNQVVYSSMLGSDIGDFDWNWIGLETAENVLLAVAYVPLQQKRKNIPPLQLGNNVTRNILVVFDGAQALTGITIDAKTWQHDFTVRLASIDERERLNNRDVFGRACFFGTALQVEKVGSGYQVKPGTAYVEGVRVSVPTALAVPGKALPTTVWLDVALERQLNDVVARWSLVCDAAKPDYKDSLGVQHYCIALADLTAQAITDRRPVEAITGPLVQHFAARNGDYPLLRARGTQKIDVGLDKIPNAITNDPSSNSTGILATSAMVQAVRNLLQTAINNIISGVSIAGRAARLATARTISLTGSATGSGSFDGSANVSIAVTVDPAKHTHTIAQTTGLQAALNSKLPTAGGSVFGATGFHQGIHGGYGSGNGGTVDWGACIWGIGLSYDGVGVNAGYRPITHYGLSWIRASHPNAIVQLGEGMYVYQNGVLKGGIGHAGIWTAGTYYGRGAGLTDLNAANLSMGTVPVGRLAGTYSIHVTGNAGSAARWAAPRTITFTGGATGAVALDGSKNVSVALTVPPTAHTHTMAQVTGLAAALVAAAPPGMVALFADAALPAGWLKANGAAVSRAAYAALFAKIGTRYGAGNGSTTFNLPDGRGVFFRGWDDARGTDAGRALGSLQAGQNASHSHTASSDVKGEHSHGIWPIALNIATGQGGGHYSVGRAQTANSTAVGAHNHTITVNASGGNESRPINLALMCCIKY